MAEQVVMWKSENGTIHSSEANALAADSWAKAERIAEAIARRIGPAYADYDAIARALLDERDAMESLVAAMRGAEVDD